MRWIYTSVIAAGVLSALLMLETAAAGQHGLLWGAAGCFAALLIAAGVAAPFAADNGKAQAGAHLIALGYLWGGASLIAIYTWSGVWWQHGRQYGTGMIVIALAIFAGARWLGGATGRLPAQAGERAAIVQAIGALGGLVFLVGAGKLASIKGDWPANIIFLTGGIAIAAVAAIGVIVARRSRTKTNGS